MSFEEIRGEIGAGFIEVRHRTPASGCEDEVTVDPSTNMAAVCPSATNWDRHPDGPLTARHPGYQRLR